MSQSRSKSEMARDRLLISKLYLRQKNQMEIASELKLSQSTVSRDLKALQDDWAKSSLMNIDEAKGRELAKIDMLELMYLEAWESSKGESKTTTKKGIRRAARQKVAEKGKEKEAEPEQPIISQEVTEHIEMLTGDPRFLQGIRDCIQERCKIIGLYAANKTDITSGGMKITQPVTTVEIVKNYEKPEQ